MNLADIRKMMNSADYSVVENIYMKIGVKSLFDHLCDITKDKDSYQSDYYQAVYEELIALVRKEFGEVSDAALESRLTIGNMIRLSNMALTNKSEHINDTEAFFIIEKLLVEPLNFFRHNPLSPCVDAAQSAF